MKNVLAQLLQWPPTSSTIHGAAALIFLGSYIYTGSWEWALGAAGTLTWLVPQDAPAIEKGLADAREIATQPKP